MLIDLRSAKSAVRIRADSGRHCLADQAAAHPIAEQRARARIQDRRPHHVAGDGESRGPDSERRNCRRAPTDTSTKVTSRMEDCSSCTPRSPESSVRWRASSCMRWSGLTPMAPSLASRKARCGFSHSPTRSRTRPSRNFSFSISASQRCATFRTRSTATMIAEDAQLDHGTGGNRDAPGRHRKAGSSD